MSEYYSREDIEDMLKNHLETYGEFPVGHDLEIEWLENHSIEVIDLGLVSEEEAGHG